MNRKRSWPVLAVFLLVTAFLPHQIQAAVDPPTGRKVLADDGASGDRFGKDVSVSGDTALIGAGGKTYVFVRNAGRAWQQQAKLPAGGSVSVFGDTAVIGDYVFVRAADGTWKLQTQLTAADGADRKGFGWSVSISRDTVLIGAYKSAYVFVRGGDGTWQQQAKLTAADGADGNGFGGSVSISGDTAVIGASGDDDNGDGSGSAYIFVRGGDGTWQQQAKLTAADRAAGKGFGNSVSISNDTVLIGAYYKSAYIFIRDDGTWKKQAKLTSADGKSRLARFGRNVSISGETALIGANGRGEAAYIFVRGGNGTWKQQTKLTVQARQIAGSPTQFGESVSVSGDTVLVGAPNDNVRGEGFWGSIIRIGDGTGSAYIYTIPTE